MLKYLTQRDVVYCGRGGAGDHSPPTRLLPKRSRLYLAETANESSECYVHVCHVRSAPIGFTASRKIKQRGERDEAGRTRGSPLRIMAADFSRNVCTALGPRFDKWAGKIIRARELGGGIPSPPENPEGQTCPPRRGAAPAAGKLSARDTDQV